jgi:ascorbate-specific PTS system EIIC-type component UlaA
MGMFAFCMGLLVVLGTVGHIEQSVSINVTSVAIQLILGFVLMVLGASLLQESNEKNG